MRLRGAYCCAIVLGLVDSLRAGLGSWRGENFAILEQIIDGLVIVFRLPF
jgi:hypothetical protein